MRVVKTEPHLLLLKDFTDSLRRFRLFLKDFEMGRRERPGDGLVGYASGYKSRGWFLQHSKLTPEQKNVVLSEVDKVLAREVPLIERLSKKLKSDGISVLINISQLKRIRNDIARG